MTRTWILVGPTAKPSNAPSRGSGTSCGRQENDDCHLETDTIILMFIIIDKAVTIYRAGRQDYSICNRSSLHCS